MAFAGMFRAYSLAATLLAALPFAAYAQGAIKVEEHVQYLGKPNNIRVSNDTVELILTTDYGPRIMRYAFTGSGPEGNVFGTLPTDKPTLHTAYGDWYIYGGHRLWHAPEENPRTYAPDNDPIQYTIEGNTVKLIQPVERQTGIVKEIWMTLDPQGSHVTVTHRLTNKNPWSIDMAAWAMSAMNKGGMAILPQEPYRSHDDYLPPIRPMVLWAYTDLTDPRWYVGKSYITLKQDVNATSSQKMGILNRQGWAAYGLGTLLFLKRFHFHPEENYPDYNSDTETYTDAGFLELETLGPLLHVAPGQTISYSEEWWLYKNVNLGNGEAGIAAAMLPILTETGRGR
jgi:hypothetical protein